MNYIKLTKVYRVAMFWCLIFRLEMVPLKVSLPESSRLREGMDLWLLQAFPHIEPHFCCNVSYTVLLYYTLVIGKANIVKHECVLGMSDDASSEIYSLWNHTINPLYEVSWEMWASISSSCEDTREEDSKATVGKRGGWIPPSLI